MAVIDSFLATDAFKTQLKTLCLNEFPCGIGGWREFPKSTKNAVEVDKVSSKFAVTLKDFVVNHEKTETLEEYTKEKHSPWNLDYSWSEEASQLREIAVKSPWLIDDIFVYSHFKTLRIIDKNVTDVDDELQKFVNLEQLILSANFLQTVNSRNLPRKLKVLELCANQISDLVDLCVKPPPLTHLGLGFNCISVLDDYITGEYWPELLSLDLSHNDLSDLLDIVRKLSALPKLRNLILQGNPLSLIPGYRGYTIDSLRKLDFLDDVGISADEKHHYKGLARRREFILDEARVKLEVKYLKGLPMPEELKNPEEQPEFPVVTRNYYVQFMFLEDRSSKAEIFQILHDELAAQSSTQGTQSRATQDESVVSMDGNLEDVSIDQMKNVNFASEPHTIHTLQEAHQELPVILEDTPVPTEELALDDATSQKGSVKSDGLKDNLEVENDKLKLAPVLSEKVSWSEEVELDWSKTLTRYDLVALRDFFKEGIDIQVVEEKILSYPADQMSEGAPSPTGSKKGEKNKGKDKKDDKGKDKKTGKDKKSQQTKGGKDDKKPDDKKKKKKGEPEIEMKHMPGEFQVLASFHLPLHEFLEGEYEVDTVYVHGDTDTRTQTPVSDDNKKDGKKKKTREGSAKKKDKDSRKSPKSRDKSPKSKGDDKKKDSLKEKRKSLAPLPPPGEEEELPPPPPLEVQLSLKLHHWKTALDSMKDEPKNT